MRPSLIGAALLSCATACGLAGPEAERCGATSARIVRAIDGDTLETEDGDRLRLLLIDAPEVRHRPNGHDQCMGRESQARSERLLVGSSVALEDDGECRDGYGRRLVYVWRDAELVNELLVREGLARVMVVGEARRFLPRVKEAQTAARSAGRGIWSACRD